MAEAARQGPFSFQVFPGDHEPPHVYVFWAGGMTKIDLLTGSFMRGHEPPVGMARQMREAYRKHIAACWSKWEELHPEGGS